MLTVVSCQDFLKCVVVKCNQDMTVWQMQFSELIKIHCLGSIHYHVQMNACVIIYVSTVD